jgi:hypothetical protein
MRYVSCKLDLNNKYRFSKACRERQLLSLQLPGYLYSRVGNGEKDTKFFGFKQGNLISVYDVYSLKLFLLRYENLNMIFKFYFFYS